MLTRTSVVSPMPVMSATVLTRFSLEQVKLLRQTFPGLDDASLASLASMARERVISPGTYLCREGQTEDTVYLICSGRVIVSQHLERETTRTLAYRGAGEFVGELSLLTENQPRTADVITIEETTVLEIEREAFLELLYRSPSVVLAILRIMAARQQESDQKTIDDLRQKYAELSRAYHRLKDETNRRSEFLTAVAHELRTPLTSIKGYLTLLCAGAFAGGALPQAVRTINTNLGTIMGLVNNILLLQEVGLVTPRLRAVVIGDVLNGLVAELQSSGNLPENLTIRTEIAAGLPYVQGDPNELKYAFSALLDNAIKFSPDGGEIIVRAYTARSVVKVQVCDPGVGIAPETLPYIFDFHHLDTTGEHMFRGIGLGLPLVKTVVENHKGVIHVKSEPGKGSTFTITLPV